MSHFIRNTIVAKFFASFSKKEKKDFSEYLNYAGNKNQQNYFKALENKVLKYSKRDLSLKELFSLSTQKPASKYVKGTIRRIGSLVLALGKKFLAHQYIEDHPFYMDLFTLRKHKEEQQWEFYEPAYEKLQESLQHTNTYAHERFLENWLLAETHFQALPPGSNRVYNPEFNNSLNSLHTYYHYQKIYLLFLMSNQNKIVEAPDPLPELNDSERNYLESTENVMLKLYYFAYQSTLPNLGEANHAKMMDLLTLHEVMLDKRTRQELTSYSINYRVRSLDNLSDIESYRADRRAIIGELNSLFERLLTTSLHFDSKGNLNPYILKNILTIKAELGDISSLKKTWITFRNTLAGSEQVKIGIKTWKDCLIEFHKKNFSHVIQLTETLISSAGDKDLYFNPDARILQAKAVWQSQSSPEGLDNCRKNQLYFKRNKARFNEVKHAQYGKFIESLRILNLIRDHNIKYKHDPQKELLDLKSSLLKDHASIGISWLLDQIDSLS